MKKWMAALTAALLAAGAARADVVVKDETGATVRLPKPASRIVSLAPHMTENLYAAGAGAKVVAAVDYSDYPPEAAKLQRIGSYKAIDVERVAALRPDLVIAWKSGNPAGQVEKLRSLGLTVYLSEPRRMEDVPEEIERLGQLAGTETAAREAAARFRRDLQALKERYAGRRPVSVFYQVWNRPLMTVSDEHLISDMVRLCGGRNVFGGLKPLAPSISLEAVLAANPEAIVASGMGEERPEWLDQWKQWPKLTAVEHGALYFIPPHLMQRPTLRVIQGTQRLCESLDDARKRMGWNR